MAVLFVSKSEMWPVDLLMAKKGRMASFPLDIKNSSSLQILNGSGESIVLHAVFMFSYDNFVGLLEATVKVLNIRTPEKLL